jgi:hypothetical protein
VTQQMHRVPRFHEIMREQTSIPANDMRDWRMFLLNAAVEMFIEDACRDVKPFSNLILGLRCLDCSTIERSGESRLMGGKA